MLTAIILTVTLVLCAPFMLLMVVIATLNSAHRRESREMRVRKR